MHLKKPLFPGESDLHQLELITRLCGTPTLENMPQGKTLPDFASIKLPNCKRRVMDEFSKYQHYFRG